VASIGPITMTKGDITDCWAESGLEICECDIGLKTGGACMSSKLEPSAVVVIDGFNEKSSVLTKL
jgi:hypothetical protein